MWDLFSKESLFDLVLDFLKICFGCFLIGFRLEGKETHFDLDFRLERLFGYKFGKTLSSLVNFLVPCVPTCDLVKNLIVPWVTPFRDFSRIFDPFGDLWFFLVEFALFVWRLVTWYTSIGSLVSLA